MKTKFPKSGSPLAPKQLKGESRQSKKKKTKGKRGWGDLFQRWLKFWYNLFLFRNNYKSDTNGMLFDSGRPRSPKFYHDHRQPSERWLPPPTTMRVKKTTAATATLERKALGHVDLNIAQPHFGYA